MRKLVIGIAAVFFLFSGSAARADQIYNITLTVGNTAAVAGTGSFEIDSAPPTAINSQEYFNQGAGLKDLTFTIDGDTFSLAGSTGTYVRFTSGSVDGIEYFGNLPIAGAIVTSSAAGLEYSFYDSRTGDSLNGDILVQSAPPSRSLATAPEPSTLTFVGTAFLAGIGFVRRRLA